MPHFTRILCIPAYLCSIAYGAIVFHETPKPLQLYPRETDDSATVVISGRVTGTMNDSLHAVMEKNNLAAAKKSIKLNFAGDSSAFSISFRIHAELAEYRFRILLDTTQALDVDSVVCGDAFIVEGQSNAVTRATGGPLGVNEWLRSFGRGNLNGSLSADSAIFRGDTAWGRAHAAINTKITYMHLYIGTSWFRLGELLIAENKIPICIINGAQGDTYIAQHLPNTANPFNLATIYGRLLYRMEKAGVRLKARALFWHQGENDSREGTSVIRNYLASFATLKAAWKNDFPAVKKVFVFQINPHFNIPEAQRQLPALYPDVMLFSTSGSPLLGPDGIHFTLSGYHTFADWIYPVVNRDFYNHPDSLPFITSPAIIKAYYQDAAQDKIVLKFDQPVTWNKDTTLFIGTDTIRASLRDYIALDTILGLIDSGWAEPDKNAVVLHLIASGSAKTISYIKERRYNGSASAAYFYRGPWLTNARKMGALLFYDIPIEMDSGGTKTEAAVLVQSNVFISNPVSSHLTIRIADANRALPAQFALYDCTGACVQTADFRNNTGPQSIITWDMQRLPVGLYILRIKGQKGFRETTAKVTIMR